MRLLYNTLSNINSYIEIGKERATKDIILVAKREDNKRYII